MNVLTNSQPGGYKSLPAELRMDRAADGSFGLRRIMASGYGMQGIGDDPSISQQISTDIQSAASATLPLLVSQTPGVVYTQAPNGQIMVNTVAAAGQQYGIPAGYAVGAGGTLVPTATATLSGDLPVLLIGAAALLVLMMGKR